MHAATAFTSPSFSHQNNNSPYQPFPTTASISIRMTRPHSQTSPSLPTTMADKSTTTPNTTKKTLHKSVCLPSANITSNSNNHVLKPSSSTSSITFSSSPSRVFSVVSASPPKMLPLSSSAILKSPSPMDYSLTTTCCAQAVTPPASPPASLPSSPREGGITVSQIISGSKSFNDFVKEEFESLRCQAATGEKNFYSGLLPQNSWKNRYHNVLPLEKSRVCLPCVYSGDSDYINANYICSSMLEDANNTNSNNHGNHSPRKSQQQLPPTPTSTPTPSPMYIACQAPLTSTIGDFWKMIWTEKSPVIVCLTKLTEQGTQKADMYWPECEPLRAGNFIVSITKKVMYKSIVVRTFLVKKVEEEDMCDDDEEYEVPITPRASTYTEDKSSNEKRVHEVVHLHFTDWPDFGTPVSTAPIYTLAQLASLLKQKSASRGVTGPITVHCSAGIGRAGTFIATHILLSKYANMAVNTPTQTYSHVQSQAIHHLPSHINTPSHQSFPPRGHPTPSPSSCICTSTSRLQSSISPSSSPSLHATSPTHSSATFPSSSFTPLITSQNSLNNSIAQLTAPSCLHDFAFSIKDVVRHLRSQRYGMVQTEDQYRYIYRVVAESIRAQSHYEMTRRKSVEDDALGFGGLVLNPFNNNKLDKSQQQSQPQSQSQTQIQTISQTFSPPLTPPVTTIPNTNISPSPLSFANCLVTPPQLTLAPENTPTLEEDSLKTCTSSKMLSDLLSSPRGVSSIPSK
eukprot:TRINITY_DN3687_c0_g1_i1.p1 TRINITY_DN3687_c0_g1~~TRINITY_DN3687_c0_g1_i1.p1  ORF type:complete len:740 (+),score=144.50 TRINITY_DN3687_c0_g1_i1:421-2640(+)